MLFGMNSVQIAVRLPQSDLEQLDVAVARGVFPSRAAAVRAALARLLHEQREREIAEEYRRAYGAQPSDEDDEALGRAGLQLGAELYAGDDGEAGPRDAG